MQRPSANEVTTPFGHVDGYPLNNGFHMGVDFSYIPDDTIYAPEDGNYRVTPNDGTLGDSLHMYVVNRHHAFGHTSKYLISDNQFITRGTPIAVMGMTGAAEGKHLHWALAVDGNLVDPLSKVTETFKKAEDDEMNADQVKLLIKAVTHQEAGDVDVAAWTGQTWVGYVQEALNAQPWLTQNEIVLNAFPALQKAVADLQKQVNDLKAQQGNGTEANLLGQALIKLLATFGYRKG